MAPLQKDELLVARQEVQHQFGDCLLQLQDYEQRLKRLLAGSDVCHTLTDSGEMSGSASTDIDRKTLGMLAGELMGSFFTVEGESFEATKPKEAEPNSPSITFRMRIALSKADFQQAEIDIRDLVSLRNDLVHHFLVGHDLKTPAGCRKAQATLTNALQRVAAARAVLNVLEKDVEEAQGAMAAYISSPEGQEFFVQGRLPWRRLKIMHALTKAEEACRIDGWASVVDAVAWLKAHNQAVDPGTYGCMSWSQVIHETRCFDLRHFARGGKRQPFFRVRGNNRVDGQEQVS